MDFKNLNLKNVGLKGIYYPLITNGLKFYVDAGIPASYPGTGTTWTDLSGEGYNSTLQAGVTYSADNGGSLAFDGGDNAYVTVPAGFGYNYSAGVTVNVWAKFTSGGGSYERLIDFGNGAPSHNIIICRNGPSNTYVMDIEGFNGDAMSPDNPAILWDQWAMYTMTADGTYWKLWRNGQFMSWDAAHGQGQYGNPPVPLSVTRTNNYIGKSNWIGLDPNFLGSISAVQLYNRALTDDEIYHAYQYFTQRLV